MRKLNSKPNVEVIGAAMSSLIANMRSEAIAPLLETHDLTQIELDQWYPAQRWLNVMNDMADKAEFSDGYVAIGMKVAENVVMPPQLDGAPLGKIFEMWDVVYKKQHRGDDIGGKTVEKISDTKYRVILDDLYPDDLSYGVAHGWCRRFLPRGTRYTVQYEDLNNRRDVSDAETTVLLIEWTPN